MHGYSTEIYPKTDDHAAKCIDDLLFDQSLQKVSDAKAIEPGLWQENMWL